MARAIAEERLAAVRATAQLLHRPRGFSHPADVAKAVCGLQAQDMRHGRLAFRARSATLRASDVERARTEERSLLHTWAMRNTLHLIATDDVPWLMPLFEPRLEAFARARLAQLGLERPDQDRAIGVIAKALEQDGPLSRTELHQRLEARGVPMTPSHRGQLIGLSVATGVACQGPALGARTLLVRTPDWLPKRPKHDRDAALAELARRYIGAFGPAGERDFAKWSGLPLRDLRAGLATIGAELSEVRIGTAPAWALGGRDRRPRGRVVRLLPAWDTYLMGYPDRSFMATPSHWRRISDGGGGIAPTIVLDGRAVGLWHPGRRREQIAAKASPFARLDPETREAVDGEIADIGRFEGPRPPRKK